MWWYKQIFLIIVQIAAAFFYIVGSHRFYWRKPNFMRFIAWGIILDLCIGAAPFIFKFSHLNNNHDVPWLSVLFLLHISTAGIGMLDS